MSSAINLSAEATRRAFSVLNTVDELERENPGVRRYLAERMLAKERGKEPPKEAGTPKVADPPEARSRADKVRPARRARGWTVPGGRRRR